MKRVKLLLTSMGLTTRTGWSLVKEKLEDQDLADKKILLVFEPYFSIQERLRQACMALGFAQENIYFATQGFSGKMVLEMNYVYITEGNTYDILEGIIDAKLLESLRDAFSVGKATVFIGASAGAILAGKTIWYCEDRNDTRLTKFDGMGILETVVFPHHTLEELEKIKGENPDLPKQYGNPYVIANEEILQLEVVINDTKDRKLF